ncbi:MAG: hypothetical protein HY830_03160, partial [Actinobacteria bacterium]|nr:hypothetical protein [Actinomycetota bacterium]
MIDRVLGELESALRADGAAAGRAMQAVWQQVGSADAAAATRALERIGCLFDGLPPGRGSRLALLAGALVERGADPAPAVPAGVDGWLEAAEAATAVARRWRRAVRRAPP